MSSRQERENLMLRKPSRTNRRMARLEAEKQRWQNAAGQHLIRAEALEDQLAKVERERDELKIERDALKAIYQTRR